jgi:glycosyltransferase involved in cell wall biosynthesis
LNDRKITVLLAINSMIIGGAEQQLLELARGLDKNLFNVIVVTLYAGGDLEPEIKKTPNVEYLCLNRKNKIDFSCLIKIYKLYRRKHVDIVQPFLTPSTLFFLLPAIITGIPVKIVTERGNLRANPGLGYKSYLRIEDYFTRFANLVIPNSESGKRYLIRRGIKADKIKVIYNGINTERLNPSPTKVVQIRNELKLPEKGVLIGISASLIPLKDHDTFLKAAKLVSERVPQSRFAILGDGPMREHLVSLTRELGIESLVTFLGNQVDVSSYLSAFDIICLCSAQPEGCSNAILEAMALGKPVVATDTGGNSELIENGKTGLLVPVKNPEALAEAIISYIRQPESGEKMVQQAKKVFRLRFSLDRMINDYKRLYLDTLKTEY